MTVSVLPAMPGMPATPTGGDAAGAEGSGDAFAGLLGDPTGAGVDGAVDGAVETAEGVPTGQVPGLEQPGVPGVPGVPVPAPVAPTAPVGEPTGEAPATDDETAVDVPVEGPVLTPAQIIAAAQVFPIAPLLAAAAAVAAAARTTGEGAAVEGTTPTGEAAPAATADSAAATASAGEQLLPTSDTVQEGAPLPGTDLTASAPAAEATDAPVDATTAPRAEGPPAPAAPAATSNATSGAFSAALTAASPLAAAQGPDGAAQSSAVTGQVFPEVSRLVSRGDGTQRITLKLQPEALGDVRVILTVRGGEVHIRMAGGELAQQALLQGAPELHRLLESVGATTSRLEIGDARSSFENGQQSRSFDLAQDEGTQDHRTARTRDGENTMATDGATGSVRTRSHGSTDNATRTRTGVDVTM